MNLIVLSVEYNDGAGEYIWHRWYVGQVKVRDYHEPRIPYVIHNHPELVSGWLHHTDSIDKALEQYGSP